MQLDKMKSHGIAFCCEWESRRQKTNPFDCICLMSERCEELQQNIRKNREKKTQNNRKTDAFQLKSVLDAVNWSVNDCNPVEKKRLASIWIWKRLRQQSKMNIYRTLLKFTWSMSLVSKQRSYHVFRLRDHKPMHFPCFNRKKDT